jgi:MFS family permease
MDHSTSDSGAPARGGINKGFLLSFIMVIGLGAVNFGYSIGVFNSMQKDFLGVFDIHLENERTFWVSMITTLSSLGAAIGSLTSGPLMKIGKKNCIHLSNAIVIVGASLTLVKNTPTVAVGRFLYGLAAGAFSVFVPSFINEITPTELKGPFGSATQILITLGIFIANILGIPMPDCLIDIQTNHCPGTDPRERPYVPGSFINDDYWRILFGLPIVFAVL